MFAAPSAARPPLPESPAGPAAASAQGRLVSRTRINPSTLAVGVFVAGTFVMLSGAGGALANVAYVALAVAAGLVLYVRDPAAYVSFTLWLWFVSPFVRRMFDLRHGWHPANPVLLAPLAVALLAGLTVMRRMKELRGVLYAPFLLVALAFAYGYAVGIITAGLIPATYALATWLAPALFGLYVAIHWRRYAPLSGAVRRTFAWALPILAAYGVYQFVRMPAWDAQWMINSGLRSIGEPRPFLARIYGTLNTPGPFGAFLCAGALMLLPQKGRVRFLWIAIAVVALLLTRTRAAWIAFLIGLAVQQMGQPLRNWPRYVVTLVAVALVAIPIARMPQFSALILPRMRTFTNLAEDNSFVKRYNFSEQAATTIVQTAEGNGLGTTGGAIKLRGNQGLRSLDNGFLEVFFIYGWPGGTLFFLGIIGLVLQSVRFRETRRDPFANAARAISVALVSMLPIGDVFTGSTGMLLWMAAGFGIAGHAYHLTTGLALRSAHARRIGPPLAEPRPIPPPLAVPGLAAGRPAGT